MFEQITIEDIGFNPLMSGYGLEDVQQRSNKFINKSFNPLMSGYGLED